jgi:hypothetical protein
MNSPLENRKVRLRGLGGPAVCGIPCNRASAAGVISGDGLIFFGVSSIFER